MSALSQRMDDAMVLRGFAERTREAYLSGVRGLAKYYGCSPAQLDAGQIQAYLLHLIQERKLAYASVNQAACAIRFFFAAVLGQPQVARPDRRVFHFRAEHHRAGGIDGHHAQARQSVRISFTDRHRQL